MQRLIVLHYCTDALRVGTEAKIKYYKIRNIMDLTVDTMD